MDSAVLSAIIAACVALLAWFLTSRQQSKAAARKESADLVEARTARIKVLAELDDVAVDRAMRINEKVIAGLTGRIDQLVIQQRKDEREISQLRKALRDAGIPIPPT